MTAEWTPPAEAVEEFARGVYGPQWVMLNPTVQDEIRQDYAKGLTAARGPLVAEALAEVERLAGMLDRTEAQIHDDDGFISAVVDQQAEIERLRAELKATRDPAGQMAQHYRHEGASEARGLCGASGLPQRQCKATICDCFVPSIDDLIRDRDEARAALAEVREEIAREIEAEKKSRQTGPGFVAFAGGGPTWMSDEPLDIAARIARGADQ